MSSHRPAQQQERQSEYSGERVLGQDVAVPDQQEVNQPERKQHRHPPCEPVERPAGRGQPFELDREAHAEEQGKQAERLAFEAQSDDLFHQRVRAVELGRGLDELLEDRHAERRDQIDHENAEQREAANGVNPFDAVLG